MMTVHDFKSKYARAFPRCRHAPANAFVMANAKINAQQIAECVEDAEIFDAIDGQDHHNIGERILPDALIVGNLAEQVFANICGVPRGRARDARLAYCGECNCRHGPADFPTRLDVKGKWDTSKMELRVMRNGPRCFERFALVEVRPSRDEGSLWVVVPRWKMEDGQDISYGRHKRNVRAVNWTWDSLVISRLCAAAMGDACMICAPWPDDGRRGAGGAAVREMRRMLGKPEEEER